MSGYAVVDVETTGFSPRTGDRVVEIAIVEVSPAGDVVDEWSTLVNPGRDLGPVSVHRIQAADVMRAPSFDEVASDVVARLRGRVFTAHNAAFDVRFVAAELARAGVISPLSPELTLCTMQQAAHYLAVPSRRLDVCCEVARVELADAHCALSDARAAAGLLGRYLTAAGPRDVLPWRELVVASEVLVWPEVPLRGTPVRFVHRGSAASQPPTAWLDRLVARLPAVAGAPGAEAYLGMLDSALLDRQLSGHEQAALLAMAADLGLDQPRVLQLHEEYVTSLVAEAWADGVVTAEELADLHAVAALLGVGAELVQGLVGAPDAHDALGCRSAEGVPAEAGLAEAGPTHAGTAPTGIRARFRLLPGDRVCFTGEMALPRTEWEQRAADAGLVVGAVTKATRLLVAGDPDSLSGKARKARGYGVPVVGEAAFAGLLAAMEG